MISVAATNTISPRSALVKRSGSFAIPSSSSTRSTSSIVPPPANNRQDADGPHWGSPIVLWRPSENTAAVAESHFIQCDEFSASLVFPNEAGLYLTSAVATELARFSEPCRAISVRLTDCEVPSRSPWPSRTQGPKRAASLKRSGGLSFDVRREAGVAWAGGWGACATPDVPTGRGTSQYSTTSWQGKHRPTRRIA
jgi:hypothetical protein